MTWQAQLFEIPPMLKCAVGSVELVPEILGESFQPEQDEVIEVSLFLKVGSAKVGNDKANRLGDWIDDPEHTVRATIIPFSPRLVRRLTLEQWQDERKTELIGWRREQDELKAKKLERQGVRPRAVS